MTERKEPTLSPLRPENDEIARHNPRAASKAKVAPPRSNIPARPVIVRSPLGPMALIVALIGLALAGYSYWQLQQSQAMLNSAESRILELEKKLEMTGDESTASVAAIQAKLKWADAEIRKLWGVSFDRNKKSIEQNTQAIAALNKGAGGVDAKIKAGLKDTKAEIRVINDLIDSQTTALVAVEIQAKAQLTQIQTLTDKARELDKLQADFKGRISRNEEAIQAIDAFRRNINQQLLQLKANP